MRRLSLYNLVFVILMLLAPHSFEGSAQTYPQIDIIGYKKYEYRDIKVNPTKNYFLGLTHIGGYYGYTAGPLQQWLSLKIIGRLTERLSVSYDVEQQPEMPDRTNVKVTYDKTELTFGDITATFGENEFASTTKFLNGVMLTSKDTSYGLTLVPSAKIRSYTQSLTSQRGTNSKGPYSLGHGGIIEGSEAIELNGVRLTRGIDYTIDYFEGKVEFTRILTPSDEFKYTYEYSSILDLFFPALSKRDFFGFRGRLTFEPTLRPAPRAEPKIKSDIQSFPTIIIKPLREVTKEATISTFEIRAVSAEGAGAILINKIPVIVFHDIEGLGNGHPRAQIVAERIKKLIDKGISAEAIRMEVFAGDYVGIANEEVIFTVDIREAEINNLSPKELCKKWIMALKKTLSYPIKVTTYIVSFEAAPFTEDEIARLGDESTGLYQLDNLPLVRFSEKLAFKGSTLKKDIDYIINYDRGYIKLLTPSLPGSIETLSVSYQYYDTSGETETFFGTGSKGPYNLKHAQIVEGTERVFVDELPYVRDLDYTIDYVSGKVTFSFKILSTQTIAIKYKYVIIITPPPPPTPPAPQLVSIGGTYLKESAKKGAGAPTTTKIEIKTGSDIISNNYTLYLQNFPLPSTTEAQLLIKLNGIPLSWEADYIVPTTEAEAGTGYARVIPSTRLAYINDKYDLSDGYTTGTIKFFKPLLPTDEVSVLYTYKRSLLERASGSGKGSVGPYYIRDYTINYRNIVPGSEIVQIWTQGAGDVITLTRNSSPDVADGNYSINYYKDSPYITFNNPLPTDKNFAIVFNYVPVSAFIGQDVIHDIKAADISYKGNQFGMDIKGDFSFAQSQTTLTYISVSTVETFAGNGGKTYQLHSTISDIIEDSERVYVNGLLRNKDIDYFINYNKPGTINFFYITPGTVDAISVEYDYQSFAGISTEQKIKPGEAKRGSINVNNVFGTLDLFYEGKKIDPDFTPMGGTAIKMGSEYQGYKGIFRGFSGITLTADLKRRLDQLTSLERDKFLHSDDLVISGDTNPYGIGLNFNYRKYDTLDDVLRSTPTTEAQQHKHDTSLQSWGGSITPSSIKLGNIIWANKNDLRRTISEGDTVDKINPTKAIIDYLHTNNSFRLDPRVTYTLDFQFSEPKTLTYEAGGTNEVLSEHSITRDLSNDLTLDLTVKPIQRFYATVRLSNYREEKFKPISMLRETKNETEHADLIPVSQVSIGFDRNRQETLSVIVAGRNPMSERTALNTKYSPLSILTFSWNGAWDSSLQESGAETKGRSNNYSIEWLPISLYQLTLSTRLNTYDRASEVTQPTLARTETLTKSLSGNYDLTYNPFPIPILTLAAGIGHENFWNLVKPEERKTETFNITGRTGITYKPMPELELSGNFTQKITEDRAGNLGRRLKNVIDLHCGYNIFNGTLNLDFEHEYNGGEVLAGSLSDLDYAKKTSSIGFESTLTQPAMILSSIVLRALWKQVIYENYKNHGDDFLAHLFAIEGTLNF